MDYKLLNDIEAVIEACCVGNGPGDVRLDYESSPAAGTLAYEIGKLLNGIHLTDKDWTLIGINIQSGLAMAAMRLCAGVTIRSSQRTGQSKKRSCGRYSIISGRLCGRVTAQERPS